MALLALNEYKLAVGDSLTDTSDDDQILQALDWASAVIAKYTDRDFDTAEVAETREYLYDGSGFLEIDDASAITVVKINQSTVSDQQWVPGPYRSIDGVYYWVENLPCYEFSSSPEMGFTRNEDKPLYVFTHRPLKAQVTATFGWPTVPDAIKQAVVWTVKAYLDEPSPFIHESIEGYSRTRSIPANANHAMPIRAQQALEQFVRVSV